MAKIDMVLPLRVRIEDDTQAVVIAQYAHKLANQLDFSIVERTALGTAILEVARNIAKYAGQGDIILDVVEKDGHQGIRVLAHDSGPGIPDIDLALTDGYSTGNSLGLGLPGAKRLMDHFEIESSPQKGTMIYMEKWRRHE